jgi:hypothetical protein
MKRAVLQTVAFHTAVELLKGASERKHRLFACACVRSVWHLLTAEDCRCAVVASEQYADGLLTRKELTAAVRRAGAAFRAAIRAGLPHASSQAMQVAYLSALCRRGRHWVRVVARVVRNTLCLERAGESCVGEAKWDAVEIAVFQEQTALLRDFIRPAPRPEVTQHFPAAVTSLAAALYDGENCVGALHDVLLEVSQDELAEHFRRDTHPKGCWALDLILGKE